MQNSKPDLRQPFEHLNSEFLNCFGFRVSCLGFVVSLLVLLSGSVVSAQVPISSRVIGTVRNEAGVPQAEMAVTLTFKGRPGVEARATPQVRTAASDRNGLFVIDQIEPGTYELVIEGGLADSLKLDVDILTATAKVLEIVVGKKSRVEKTTDLPITDQLNAKLITVVEFQLGGEVKEPVVSTHEAVLGSSIDPQVIAALPLRGRNYLDLLLLQPGVVEGNGGEGFGSFSGGRATAQNFTLDGTENTDTDIALPSLFENGAIALDAIQDFRIVRSNANAEFGRNSGGQVSLFIKRGANELHGSAYEFFSNDRLNARDFFDRDPQFGRRGFKPPLTRNQFGLNLGGPLVRDKHFFFAGFEGYRNREGLPRHPRVPTGGESGFRGQLTRFYEFVEIDEATGLPLDGPSPLLVATLLRAYPTPTRSLINPDGRVNGDIGIFDTTIPLRDTTNSFLVRTDHQITGGNRLRVRYAVSDGSVSVIGNGLLGTGAGKDFRPQNVSIVDTQLVGKNVANEFRFGFSRNRVSFPTATTPPEIQALAGLTLQRAIPTLQGTNRTFAQLYPDIRFGANNDTTTGFPHFVFNSGQFSDFGVDAGSFPQGRARNTFQFGDTLSLIRGSHSFRFGFDIRRLQQNSISGFNLRPTFIIPDAQLDSLFSDRIVGGRQNFFLTRDSQPNGPILRGLRSTESGFFVQDNFRLAPRLTLDVGLRYEVFGREGEANDFLSRAVNYQLTPFSPQSTIAQNFTVSQFSDQVGFKVRNSDLNDFGPRLGIAWDPVGDGRMAVRAAYGIYYDHIQGSTIFPNQLNPPGVLGFVIPSEIVDTQFGLRNVRLGQVPVPRSRDGQVRPCSLTGGRTGFLNPVGGCEARPLPLNVIDPDMRDPYTQRWNLTVQRELDRDTFVEIGYVGSKGTKLARARTPNLGGFIEPRALAAFFGRSRPNAGIDELVVQESSASSIYHSLQVNAQRRLSAGLTFQAGYTFSKSLDDVSSNVAVAGAGGSVFPQNSFDFSSERGLSAFHLRHRFVAHFVYDLPFGPERRFLGRASGLAGKVIEGWSVSGIVVAQTGFPLTLQAGVDVNADGILNDRPVVIGRLNNLMNENRDQADKTRFFVAPRGIVDPGRGEFFDPRRPPAFYSRNLLRPFDPRILAPRSSFIGVGRNKFDVAVRKLTRLENLRSGAALEFRAEVFNLFNRANLGDPEIVITSPQFGEITATTTGPRFIQFALALRF
jgi:hypothetical protein